MADTTVRLSRSDAELALQGVDAWFESGVPADHVRRIALGEVQDDRFEQMRKLRESLRELVRIRVTIGRIAFDHLTGIEWPDGNVERALQGAKVGKTRVTISAPREVVALFADVLREQGSAILNEGSLTSNGDRVAAKRFAEASRRLAAELAPTG